VITVYFVLIIETLKRNQTTGKLNTTSPITSANGGPIKGSMIFIYLENGANTHSSFKALDEKSVESHDIQTNKVKESVSSNNLIVVEDKKVEEQQAQPQPQPVAVKEEVKKQPLNYVELIINKWSDISVYILF
jgi:hypothetical protein